MPHNVEAPLELPPSTVPTSSRLKLPPRLYVPVSAGAAASVLKPGTQVACGAELVEGKIGAGPMPLAPAAGTIGAAVDITLIGGAEAKGIELIVDASAPDAWAAEASALVDAPTDLAALLERLSAHGVSATRHTSPDLLAQLHEARTRPADLVICNLLDVDGGSSLNGKIIRESGASVVAGVAALAAALNWPRVFIAADPGLANRASVLVRKAQLAGKIKVVGMENDYPQADPSLLVYALSGRRLAPFALPMNACALLLDGAAAAAIGRCVSANEPMLTVPIEVRDATRARTHVVVVAVGTPLRFVLEELGLNASYTLRAGAALRDVRITDGAVVSGGGELSIDAGLISAPINPDPCIRSGWCLENCPVRINPAGLLEAAQEDDPVHAEEHGLHACIECGICSYVCPSRLPLLAAIRDLRSRPAGAPKEPTHG